MYYNENDLWRWGKQYAKLWRYKAVVKECNVGLTIKIASEEGVFFFFWDFTSD